MKKFWREYFLFQKEPSPGWSRGQRELYYAYRVALLLCAGLCMGLALLVLAIGPYPRGTLVDYLCHWQTLLLNTVPVALLILLNLAGMGCFQGLALDLRAAAKDIAAILSQRPDSPQ